jgi:hypothetical protein
MNQVTFYRRKEVSMLIIIVSLFVSLSLYNCGGGGSSDNNPPAPQVNTATLTWDAPTTNADGTPLTDLAGYKIYYGTTSGNYTEVMDVGNVITYKVEGLQPGTYYFAVTAYDNLRNESGYLNEVSKTIKNRHDLITCITCRPQMIFLV